MSRLWRLSPNQALLLVLTALLLMVCSAAAAAGQSAGHITGAVIDENTGAPLAGILVNVHQTIGSWQIRGSTITGADGFYDVGDLDPGVYRVSFFDPSGNHVTEAYNDASYVSISADITVSAGQTTSGINASLAGAGHIAGRVTSQATGNPLPGIQVRACRWDGARCQWQWDSAKGDWVSTTTDAEGMYNLGGRPAGPNRLRFFDAAGRYYTEYYDDALSDTGATDISVVIGQTTPDIDAALSERGRIAGKVTDRISGKPLPGIRIGVYISVGGWPPWAIMGDTTTDADGVYSIGMSAGTYRVEFTDPTGVCVPGDPVNIVVYNGRTTSGIDATLVTWGRITGTVTARATGDLLPGIQVTLHQWNGGGWSETKTTTAGSDGGYAIGGLAADTYRVRFSDPNRRYQTSFYDGASDIESATAVTVTLGHTTAGVNAALVESGRITGTVTAEVGGQPLAGIQVAFSPATSWGWGSAAATVTSGADGAYDSGGLDANLYRVSFADPSGKYAAKEFGSYVRVTAAETTPGIDATLRELGHVAGRVTAHDTGLPLPGISVEIYHCYWYHHWHWGQIWECDWVAAASTGPDGRYDFGGLADDVYEVEFSDPNGVYVTARRTDIQVTDHQVIAGIDVALDRLEAVHGHIAGTVTARRTGVPLNNVVVSILGHTFGYWGAMAHAYTDANGDYDIGGLPPGVYRIEFFDGSGRFDRQYYDSAGSLEAARDVDIVAGMVTSEINAELLERGYITGKVVAETTGEPLPDVSVFFEFSGGSWGDSATSTDADGHYRSGPLAAGVYQVHFGRWQYRDPSVQVSVTSEQETSGIDAALIELGHITGRVTAETTGLPLPGIRVECYAADNLSAWPYVSVSNADGSYKSPYLASGAYRLQFRDQTRQYTLEVYDNATSIQGGTDVLVADGQTTAGIDAALAERERNRISGTATDQETGAPLPGIRVELWLQDGQKWSWLRAVTTAADGVYDSGKLADGVYRIGFRDLANHYQYEYYDNVGTLESGVDINAAGGQSITGIDAALSRLGSITGRVTDQATGAPVAGIRVTAYKWNGQYADSGMTGTTGADGSYAINSLFAGTYRVRFEDASRRYLGGYYRDAGSIVGATDIAVTAGQVTENIDAALTPWGQITGKVTDRATGQALSGVWVTLWYWYEGWRAWDSRSVSSQADGAYAFGGLNAGVYRIEFYDPKIRYRFQFYSDAVTIETATDVTFVVGQTTSGIDAALVRIIADATPTPTVTVTTEATLTATPTATAEVTPTSTATITVSPTATPTPSATLPREQRRVYLPVILR